MEPVLETFEPIPAGRACAGRKVKVHTARIPAGSDRRATPCSSPPLSLYSALHGTAPHRRALRSVASVPRPGKGWGKGRVGCGAGKGWGGGGGAAGWGGARRRPGCAAGARTGPANFSCSSAGPAQWRLLARPVHIARTQGPRSARYWRYSRRQCLRRPAPPRAVDEREPRVCV